ncbi:helix-turn-helix domain-containing protein [Listeria monocytogenes]|uniref:helix-turn-helix domain-containing protein n=1 Tax=Listeria monocytogenes TaxID=1639 RepID=UPI003F9783BB|nr:helix-turn-helix domain-containing protein [Listeria monocytogenes]EIL5159750.1 helix-turn-helix domain-containing protein [Listeria monocytogenes]
MSDLKNQWTSNFFQVPNAIYDNADLNVYELAILQYLFRLSNNNKAYPALTTIAKMVKCSKPTVIKSLESLMNKGYLTKQSNKTKNGNSSVNIYYLLNPSKGDLPGVVNEVYYPSKGDLPGVVNEVYPINTNTINTNIQNNNMGVPADYSQEFEEFWKVYPRKKEKKRAYTAFKRAKKKHGVQTIMQGTKAYADESEFKKTEEQFIKHATTFLNNESYLEFEPRKEGYHAGSEQPIFQLPEANTDDFPF